jgi:hypothetical protein
MLGIPVMDEGAFNDFLIDVISEGERRTAECMIGEGFEYTPETPTIDGPSAAGNTDTREYAEQRGFGIVAAFEAATLDTSTPLPPNQVYLATLTEGERDAYQMALFGEIPGEERPGEEGDGQEGSDTNDGFPSAGTGCKALAIDELGEVFAVMDEFGPAAEEIFIQFDSDMRMLELNETWSACMADAGYLAAERNSVQEIVWTRLDELFQGRDIETFFEESDVDPELYETESVWSDFLSGNSFSPHPPLTAEGQAIADELAAYEVDVAVTNFDCYEPLRETEMAVQLEYEELLVANLGDEIGARLGDD